MAFKRHSSSKNENSVFISNPYEASVIYFNCKEYGKQSLNFHLSCSTKSHGFGTTYFGWTIPLCFVFEGVFVPGTMIAQVRWGLGSIVLQIPQGESVTFLINSHKPGFPEAAVVQIQAWLPQDPYALFRASCDISKQSLETICNHSQYRTM